MLVCAFVWICGAGVAAAKERISVGKVDGSGVTQQELKAVENLLRSEIISHGGAELVESGGDMTINASVSQLKDNYIVMLTGTRSNGEKQSEKTKIASFDEVDVAIKRLVAAMIEGVHVQQTAERGAVFSGEQREMTRVKSIAGWEFFLGAGWPITDALKSHETMWALGIGYGWDVYDWLVDIRADFQAGFGEVRTNTMSFTIGTSYVWLNQRKFGLFSGAEMGFAHVRSDDYDDSKSGFTLVADTGILFLRHSNINLDLRMRAMFLTDNFNGEVPIIGGLLIGLHW